MITKSARAHPLRPTDSGPRFTTSDPASEQSEEPRMIGDFDGSSNALWTLFKDEAKSHDDARINTLKDGMESCLIFVCSYLICTMDSVIVTVILMRGLAGRFIFRCPHCIRSR
jgi:hypothetical protein